MTLRRLLVFLLAFCASPFALAQSWGGAWEIQDEFVGTTAFTDLGFRMDEIEDLDSDGVTDLVIAEPGALVSGVNAVGRVWVLSGADGDVIHQIDGELNYSRFGQYVSVVDDLNNDGFQEVIVAIAGITNPPLANQLQVRSGLTGALLYDVDLAGVASASSVEDVNSDGTPDFVVGQPGGDGIVSLRSGADGSELWSVFGQTSQEHLGQSVLGMRDLNGDSTPDIAAGGPGPTSASSPGYVRFLSGASGAQFNALQGEHLGDTFGGHIGMAGDIDADGTDDIFVNARTADPDFLVDYGAVYYYSGATGQLLWRIIGELRQGAAAADVPFAWDGFDDLDGDGHADMAMTIYTQGFSIEQGRVRVLSGRTGGVLTEIEPPATLDSNSGFPQYFTRIEDVDGTGRPGLLVAAWWQNDGPLTDAGWVGLYAFDHWISTSSSQLSVSGGGSIAIDIEFPGSEAAFNYALLASLAGTGPTMLVGTQVPLTPDPLFQKLVNGWQPPALLNGFGVLDAQGDGQATLSALPALTQYIGRTVYFAAVSYHAPTLTTRASTAPVAVQIVP